jgi:hypothetical protein
VGAELDIDVRGSPLQNIVRFDVPTMVTVRCTIFRIVTPCRSEKESDGSEEHIASMFVFEEEARQKTSNKLPVSR